MSKTYGGDHGGGSGLVGDCQLEEGGGEGGEEDELDRETRSAHVRFC